MDLRITAPLEQQNGLSQNGNGLQRGPVAAAVQAGRDPIRGIQVPALKERLRAPSYQSLYGIATNALTSVELLCRMRSPNKSCSVYLSRNLNSHGKNYPYFCPLRFDEILECRTFAGMVRTQTRHARCFRFARYSANDSALRIACCLPLGSLGSIPVGSGSRVASPPPKPFPPSPNLRPIMARARCSRPSNTLSIRPSVRLQRPPAHVSRALWAQCSKTSWAKEQKIVCSRSKMGGA